MLAVKSIGLVFNLSSSLLIWAKTSPALSNASPTELLSGVQFGVPLPSIHDVPG